jgi:hypothetical protein
MIAGVLRRVLLSYASNFLENVDVDSLSLWGGEVTLQNVVLNAHQINLAVKSPCVAIKQGSIAAISVEIPWTALNSKSIRVKLSKVFIRAEISELSDPEQTLAEAVTEIEENLLQRIQGNIQLQVDGLTVVAAFTGESSNFLCVSLESLDLHASDPDTGKYEFVNPYYQVPGGSGYRFSRQVTVSDLKLRVLNGQGDEYLSDVVLLHKFETKDCGGCALCYAFKVSSFYTLFALETNSLVLSQHNSWELSLTPKSDAIKVMREITANELSINCVSPVQLKLSLIDDSKLVRDAILLASLLSRQPRTPDPPLPEPQVQDSSWISWGAAWILSPLYCNQAQPRHSVKRVTASNTSINWTADSILAKVKIYNPVDFAVLRLHLNVTPMIMENKLRTTSCDDPLFSQSDTFKVTQGKLGEASITAFLKRDYLIAKAQDCSFSSETAALRVLGKNFEMQVVQGLDVQPSKSVSSSRIELRLVGSSIELTSGPLDLQMKVEEMTALSAIMMQLTACLTRLQKPFVKGEECSLSNILHYHSQQLTHSRFASKHDVYEATLSALKKHAGELNSRLQTAEDELSTLRRIVASVANPTGQSGVISLDTSEVRATAKDCRYAGKEASLVVTRACCLVVNSEGRLISKVLVEDIAKIEERGDNDIVLTSKTGGEFRVSVSNRPLITEALRSVVNAN